MNLWQAAVFLVVGALALIHPAVGAPSTSSFYVDPEARASLELTPVAERWSGEGFFAVSVRVKNDAGSARSWTLRFSTELGYSGDAVLHEATFPVGAGETTEAVIYVPGGGAVESGQRAMIRVSAEGPGMDGSQVYLLHGNSDPAVITATTPAQETALFAATNGAPGIKSEINAVDPARWPADWRVWSAFDRVVMTDAEFAVLDGARRAALRDWVALGGTLDLYPARGDAVSRVERVGRGAIRHRQQTLASEAADQREARPYAGEQDALQAQRAVVFEAERRAELTPASGAFGLSLFLVAFGLLVGPINLFVFAPSNRRHRLFITVPLISLAASALMGVYIVVKDGFGGEGSRIGLVLLLPESNQAVVTQSQLTRTGVLLGAGFPLADDVVLSRGPEHTSPAHFHGRANADQYVRADGAAGGDWFTSRRLQGHGLKRLVPTRARVELVAGGSGDAAPVVQSSVGAVLGDFRYRDAEGRTWGADRVAPGEKVTLSRKSFVDGDGLKRGEFAALGGAAEGLAPIETLSSIRWDEPRFLYAGPLVGARTP